jgi:GT2 family glycosyltransferase
MRSDAAAVVVVNYTGERFLRECIESARSQTVRPAEIVVVDNASSDRSVELIRENFPGITLLPQGKNQYFCRGSNIGLAATSAPFVLLLNNDAFLEPDYIERALEPMLRDERVGAVTGKILRPDRETVDSAGQELARSRKPLDRGYGQQDGGQFDDECEVFGAGGVAPLLRRRMLADISVGGQVFDEAFVHFQEDLDLAWRARNLGWKAWYTPAAVAYHHRGGTGQSEPARQTWARNFAFANLPSELQYHLLKNRYAAMAKNDRLGSWLLGLPWILLYELKILTYLLLIKPSLIPRYFKGLAFIGHGLRMRRELKRMARERGIRRYGGRHSIVQGRE